MNRSRMPLAVLAALLVCAACPSSEARADASVEDLSKQTQNPVADLTAVPLQFNFISGGAFVDETYYNLNIQPVFPLPVWSGWKLIARTIVPYVNVPLPGPGSSPTGIDRATGIGDIQEQLFFTPAGSGSVTWGLGPILSFPTATNDAIRTGDWAAGPNAVFVITTGPWVIGGLANQLWSYKEVGGDPKVNQFLIQPFVNYNMAHGWAFSTAPIITANWEAPDDEQWTVPVGMGVSKVTSLGSRPMSLSLQYYHLAERPSTAGADQVRFVTSFLFPNPGGK